MVLPMRKGLARLPTLISLPYVLEELLLLCVSLIEFVNTSSGVYELHLTSVEWVRCVRDLEFDNRVLDAINLDGLLCVRA